MQLRRTWVSTEECQWRLNLQHCFYSGKAGHHCTTYPEKPSSRTDNVNLCSYSLLLPVQVQCANEVCGFPAHIDSGPTVNVFHHQLVEDLLLPIVPCTMPLERPKQPSRKWNCNSPRPPSYNTQTPTSPLLEVDASSCGIRAMLLQWHPRHSHPLCMLFQETHLYWDYLWHQQRGGAKSL